MSPRSLPAALAVTALALVLIAVPAAAQAPAGPFSAALGGRLGPTIKGLPASPKALSLTVDASFDSVPAGGQPPTLRRAVISFPFGSRLNATRFPTCTAARLNARHADPAACPSGSRIGTGRVVAIVSGSPVQVRLDLVNGPRGRSILFVFRARQPVVIEQVVQAPLQTINGPTYQFRLTLNVPAVLQQPIQGLFAGVKQFTATVSRKTVSHGGKRIGYVEALACPPGARVPLRGDFTYVDGTSQSVDSFLACGG
jgi:hypothetical protein